MKNGFIYPIVGQLVILLKYLNLVEGVKFVSSWLVSKGAGRKLTKDENITAKNFAIDTFMVAKWCFVIFAMICGGGATWVKWVVWYLIATNLFTYFFYHVWRSDHEQRVDIDSQRRRFISFILALGFYLFCYAYLYQYHYFDHISWPENCVDFINSMYLSIANAFTLTYGGFSPKTQFIRVVFVSELINTFFFFTIIIVNSVPTGNKAEKKDVI